jgi:hypothetical protein
MTPTLQVPAIAESLPRASDFRVLADGHAVPVLDTQVGAVASFAFAGSLEVVIEAERAPSEVLVRPLSRAIPCRVEGRRITLSLDRPGNFSVEFDGDIRRPLFLFAGPVRKDEPRRADPGVIWLEVGKMHRFDELRLTSDQTLYFESGAVLEAPVRAADAENIRILGAGIIDSRYRTERPMGALKFTRCKGVLLQDVHIEDITIRNLQVQGSVIPPSIFKGYDEQHAVRRARIEGLTVAGQAVRDAEAGRFRMRHAEEIIFA